MNKQKVRVEFKVTIETGIEYLNMESMLEKLREDGEAEVTEFKIIESVVKGKKP